MTEPHQHRRLPEADLQEPSASSGPETLLRATFCHIPGIGYATERALWNRGVCSWQQLLERTSLVSRVSRREISAVLNQSAIALEGDPGFFSSRLKNRDRWRLFDHYRDATAYLDIETSGLSADSEITTIALYDGNVVKTYVNGVNLEQFLEEMASYQVIVTYNGLAFDIPFIERYFRTRLSQVQIDLRFVLAALGCTGGLKGAEKQLGINRGALDGLDGSFAVSLWREYQRCGDEALLETLLAYNVEDTVNLERLLVEAYNRNLDQTPFGAPLQLPFPEPPPMPFHPDLEVVDRYLQARQSWSAFQ